MKGGSHCGIGSEWALHSFVMLASEREFTSIHVLGHKLHLEHGFRLEDTGAPCLVTFWNEEVNNGEGSAEKQRARGSRQKEHRRRNSLQRGGRLRG